MEIEVKNLSVCYETPDGREFVALDDVSLQVQKGEFLVIVGPSGCGKTTLLSVLAGLQAPTTGTALVGGQVIRGPGPDRAVVFQNYALLPWRTVRQNVNLVYELNPSMRRSKKEQEERIASLLQLVGLGGFAGYHPGKLSGGMQQRVGLARALLAEPRVLLMDEPFAAVDVMTREYMQGEIERILESDKQLTIVFVTHGVEEAVMLGDRVLVMSSPPGKIKANIEVKLPRPRRQIGNLKMTPEFRSLCEEIWNLLKDDVKKSVQPGVDLTPALPALRGG